MKFPNWKPTIRIIDPKSPYFGEDLKVLLRYYDHLHTGDSEDLFFAETKDGDKRFLSNQIDKQLLESEEIRFETEALGAKVGNLVNITRYGSGSFSHKFDYKSPHVITKIFPSGDIELDNGLACCFRPDVSVVITTETSCQ